MSVTRHTAKAFYVALLSLFLTVAVSAQNIAELKKQAAAGDANAQFNLGAAYYSGNGVPKDAAESVRWWRKAAAQGDAQAQSNLALVEREAEDAKKPRYVAVPQRALAQSSEDAKEVARSLAEEKKRTTPRK